MTDDASPGGEQPTPGTHREATAAPAGADPAAPHPADPAAPHPAAPDPADPAPARANPDPTGWRAARTGRRPTTDAAERAGRRQRLLILGVAGMAGLVAIALLICAVLWAAHLGGRSTRNAARPDRPAEACLGLESRLNRLSPPGAAPDAARRAIAIRAENAAVRPFLDELSASVAAPDRAGPRHRPRPRPQWLAAWRQLVDARTAYADALDRQARGGEPAFFVQPRSERGVPVARQLARTSPPLCQGALRRLAQPDL